MEGGAREGGKQRMKRDRGQRRERAGVGGEGGYKIPQTWQ